MYIMSILGKVYCKFLDLEILYQNEYKNLTRDEFVKVLFGGSIDEGATLLTEAIMCEKPSTSEELEQFVFLKDLFNFFIKHYGELDTIIYSFNDISSIIATENELFDDLDKLLKVLTTKTCNSTLYAEITQADLLRQNKAFHYYITPSSVHYTRLDNCKVHYILSNAHGELCSRMFSANKKLTPKSCYINGKTGLRKIAQKDARNIILQEGE